jgi:hypothetical protein
MTRLPSLLILLACLLPVAGCGSATHHTPAGAPSHLSTMGASARETAAALFAASYVRFLDGSGTTAALPDATRAVRAIAGQAGQVPGRRRRGTLVLTQLRRTQGAAISYFVAARDQAHTFYAQITLGLKRGRWVVVQLTPPDFAQALAPAGPPAPAPPRASAAPGTTARRFLQGYLRWLYGQVSLHAIEDATTGLLVGLKSHPPRIPAGMRSLHATVAAIALQRDGSGWQALPNITDGRETYELVLTITQRRGRWLVSGVRNPR